MTDKAIPFTATLSFNESQTKELIKAYIRSTYGFECEVTFTCGAVYGQFDRETGHALQRVDCLIKNGSLLPKNDFSQPPGL